MFALDPLLTGDVTWGDFGVVAVQVGVSFVVLLVARATILHERCHRALRGIESLFGFDHSRIQLLFVHRENPFE
jgi:hypothetical protein